MLNARRGWIMAACLIVSEICVAVPVTKRVCNVNIPAQALPAAVKEVVRQCPVEIVYEMKILRGKSPAFSCPSCTVAEIFSKLLANSGVRADVGNDRLVTIVKDEPPQRAPPAGPCVLERENILGCVPVWNARWRESAPNLPEILVEGSNAGVPREADDIHPFQVFGPEVLQRSFDLSAADFLRNRLTMLTGQAVIDPNSAVLSHLEGLNLNGLGANRTRLRVNGRPRPFVYTGGEQIQSGLRGIPVMAVERIEVLPEAADGIYGPGVTSGVVNVVLWPHMEGTQVRAAYENPADQAAGERNISFAGGHSLWDGNTDLTWYGTYSERAMLATGDRPFAQAGRNHVYANNPEHIADLLVPPEGALVNYRSRYGKPLFGPGTPSFGHVPAGVTGFDLEQFRSGAGTYDLQVPDTAAPGANESALLSGYRQHSINATARSELPAGFDMFLELGHAKDSVTVPFAALPWLNGAVIDAGAPGNPFEQDIVVSAAAGNADGRMKSEVEYMHATLGFTKTLPHDWNAGIEASWGQSAVVFSGTRAMSGEEAVRNGTLKLLRDLSAEPLDLAPYLGWLETSELRADFMDVSVRFGGPALDLKKANVTLTGLLEHLEERLGDGQGVESVAFGPDAPLVPRTRLSEQRRTTDSVYLEARFQPGAPESSERCAQKLEILAASRLDISHSDVAASRVPYLSTRPEQRYRSKFTSFNPNVGACSRLSNALMVRASYGTGAMPPPLNYLTPTSSRQAPEGEFIDGRRGDERSRSLELRNGGSVSLLPEKSSSWSVGFVFKPEIADRMRISLDYTRFSQRDNIVVPNISLAGDLAQIESLIPGRVTRGAPEPGDPFGIGPVTIVDMAAANAERRKTDIFQGELDFILPLSRFGTVRLETHGTYQPRLMVEAADGVGPVNLASLTSASALKWRLMHDLSFSQRGFTIGVVTHFFDDYKVSSSDWVVHSQGASHVPNQVYHDLYGRFEFSPGSFDGNVQVQAGVRNVLNTRPPLDVRTDSYYSTFGDPRMARYFITLKVGFGAGGR